MRETIRQHLTDIRVRTPLTFRNLSVYLAQPRTGRSAMEARRARPEPIAGRSEFRLPYSPRRNRGGYE